MVSLRDSKSMAVICDQPNVWGSSQVTAAESPGSWFSRENKTGWWFQVSTHLKNMRKSNWIISPGTSTKMFERPPTRWNIYIHETHKFQQKNVGKYTIRPIVNHHPKKPAKPTRQPSNLHLRSWLLPEP